MNELSNLEFLKLLSYRLSKITEVTDEELKYIDYIMYKTSEIAKKMRYDKLTSENQKKILQIMASEGFDISVLLADSASKEDANYSAEMIQSAPPSLHSQPESSHPSLFQQAVDPSDILPALNASKPSDALRISFQNESKSFNKRHNIFEEVLEAYETEPFENEDEPSPSLYKPKPIAPQAERKTIPTPATSLRSKPSQSAAKSRGRSPTRGRSRSTSPPSRARSKSRGRYRDRSRSRSRSRGRYRGRSKSRSRRPSDYYY